MQVSIWERDFLWYLAPDLGVDTLDEKLNRATVGDIIKIMNKSHERKPSAYYCPNCKVEKNHTHIEHFSMPSGKEAYAKSCEVCGSKRFFNSDGRPLNKHQVRMARQVTMKTSSRKTGLEEFLKQTASLNTYEKGLKFEQYCQKLLEEMGYEVEHSGKSGDRGVDLMAVRQQPIGSQALVVQCKHQESVAHDVVRGTFGMAKAKDANAIAVVITTGSFTGDAKKFAEESASIELIDGNKLAKLVEDYFR